MAQVTVLAPAKINLALHVGPARADGYHQLETVYCAVSLYDELTATSADGLDLRIEGEGAGFLPTGDKNLVIRAACLLADTAGIAPRAALLLRKTIPVAAGLAGGSTDAAAALVACNELWGLRYSAAKLAEFAAELGSDVPFPLFGGVALGHGRGELITELPPATRKRQLVVAAADFGLSTPRVFAELDRLRAAGLVPAGTPFQKPADGDAALSADFYNDLNAAAISLAPGLLETISAGTDVGGAAVVSGSGPTVIFMADDLAQAEAIAHRVSQVPGCRWAQPVTGPVDGVAVVSARR